jgi:hypothetical protein
MRQRRQGNGARPKHDQRRERPHRAAKSRPGPFGLRGSLPPLAARNRSSCFGRAEGGRRRICKTRCQTNSKGGTNESMAIIKAPPKQPKSVTIQARVEESVKTQLDQYAKFIDSTPSYVITEALRLLYRKDKDFQSWLGQHTNNHNPEQIQGDVLTKTA